VSARTWGTTRCTILLVDEDSEDRRLYEDWLREHGYQVKVASTGSEAISLAQTRPDLVLLSLRLPDQDGLAVCRRIKTDPTSRSVPVVLFSMGANDDIRSLSLESGADAYLQKDNRPPVFLNQVHTILRAQQAEKGRRACEAQLQAILDRSPLVVYLKDADSRYLLVNHRWEQLFRISREELVGKTVFDIHPRHRASVLWANDLQVLQRGELLEFEEEVEYEGSVHTYRSAKFPLFNAEGEPYAVCGISVDITDRKKADRALRDSQALYSSLVAHLPLMLYRKNLEGQFTFANRAFSEQFQLTPAQIQGRTDAELYADPLAHKYREDDRAVMQVGAVFEELEARRDPSGEIRYLEVLKAPVCDSQNQVVGMQGILHDVTERLRTEEELRRTAMEFRVARKIQQKLFPTRVPQVEGMDIGTVTYGFDIGGASFPAEAIGGDSYDYLRLPDGSLGLTIGDVSGHGLGPALLMAETRAYLRAFAKTQSDPGAILKQVNLSLIEDIQDEGFITLLFAQLDLCGRNLFYASAGHPTGFVLDRNGEIKAHLESLSVPLGVFEEANFPCAGPIQLAEGDIVLFVTDGVTEARNPENQTFGADRAVDLVRVYRSSSARQIVENLYHGVRAFCRNEPQIDDITATVIKVESSQ
jgi:sigma-B regulation protein RsbU (phosphoserine phosphatase)